MADDPQTPPQPVVVPPEPVVPTSDPYADRFDRLERMVTGLTGQMSQYQQNTPVSAPSSPQELKDEELWALAQQGNRQAFEMYMERIADRRSGSKITNFQEQQSVQNQVVALYTKYPELSNPNHPLTQRAVQFKAALQQMGAPQGLKTDLDAILRAVADSREILSPRVTQATQTPQSGQMGVQHRQAEPTTQPAVTPDELALARKMGTKDPAKAKERFWARNAEGRSSVSPTIAAALERPGA